MQLDYDLIRELLLYFEDICDGVKNYPVYEILNELENEKGKNRAIARYHLKYLIDADFLQESAGYIFDLTPAGHNFTNSIRNISVWQKFKEKAQSFGCTLGASVAADVASGIVHSALGL